MCLHDNGMLTQRALLRHPKLTAKPPQIHLNSSVQRYTVEESGKNAKKQMLPITRSHSLPCLPLSTPLNCGLSISKAQMLKRKP